MALSEAGQELVSKFDSLPSLKPYVEAVTKLEKEAAVMRTALNQPNYVYRAKIATVVDGDTVDCDLDLGFHLNYHVRLRLARINAPEMPSDSGQAAKAYLAQFLEGKDVTLSTKKTDPYGRYIAEVVLLVEGQPVNVSDHLLEKKLVKPYKD